MRRIIFILFVLGCLTGHAQLSLVKYYDNEWQTADSNRHVYKAVFIPEGSLFKTTVYWKGGDKIAGTGTFQDTTLKKPVGLFVGYHKNGQTEDSSYYNNENEAEYHYRYYKNKQLELRYYIPEGKTAPVVEGFTEEGKPIKGYIYEQEAEFKGGDKAWLSYLVKNLSKDLYAKDKENTTVTVKVMFCVGSDGYVTKVKVKESSGISYVDADAVRVVSNSPQWKSAIQYNKPVKAYRLQPITYELAVPKK